MDGGPSCLAGKRHPGSVTGGLRAFPFLRVSFEVGETSWSGGGGELRALVAFLALMKKWERQVTSHGSCLIHRDNYDRALKGLVPIYNVLHNYDKNTFQFRWSQKTIIQTILHFNPQKPTLSITHKGHFPWRVDDIRASTGHIALPRVQSWPGYILDTTARRRLKGQQLLYLP